MKRVTLSIRTLILVGGALLLLGACVGDSPQDQELATIDRDGPAGDADQVDDPDLANGADSRQSTVIVGDASIGEAGDRSAPQTERDLELSPADRQRNQATSPGTPRTSDDVVPEPESLDSETTDPETQGSSDPEAQRSGDAGSATSNSAPPGLVQRDIVIPDGALERTSDDGPNGAVGVFGVDRVITDERILAEISPGAASYSCQPGIDSECSEAEPEPPAEVPSDVAEVPEPEDAGPSEATADDPCPPGSSPSCSSDPPALPAAPTSDSAGNSTSGAESGAEISDDGGSAAVGVDCEARPWGRGCAGPVPDPETVTSTYGDGEDEDDDAVNAPTDPADGVQVPQEVIDILLTPPPADDQEPNNPVGDASVAGAAGDADEPDTQDPDGDSDP